MMQPHQMTGPSEKTLWSPDESHTHSYLQGSGCAAHKQCREDVAKQAQDERLNEFNDLWCDITTIIVKHMHGIKRITTVDLIQ